jgi:hypothetical protein
MSTPNFPDIVPDAVVFGLESNTTVFESELSNAVQHGQLTGDRWNGVSTFTNRGGLDARKLKAFVSALGGPSGRFKMSPPDMEQLGTRLGAGAVAGANQVGNTIATGGWNPNQPILFEVGDYFEVNGELKQISERIASNGSGNATLKFSPPLRRSPANTATIITDNPMGLFYLADDNQASWRVSAPYIYALSLTYIEDVN